MKLGIISSGVLDATPTLSADSATLAGSTYLDAGNPASLQITGDMTVVQFVYLGSGSNGQNAPIISKWRESTNQRGWIVDYRDEGGQDELRFTIQDQGDGLGNSALLSYTPASGFDSWYHIGARYDGTNADLWIDGVEEDTVAYSSGIHNSTEDLLIGASNGGTRINFEGSYGFGGIWNIALTDAQMLALYNGGKGICYDDLETIIPGITTGLVSYWHTSEFTGHTTDELTDQEGSNNLTDSGTTGFSDVGLEVQCSP